jgi:hypothetical protein
MKGPVSRSVYEKQKWAQYELLVWQVETGMEGLDKIHAV